MGQPGVRVCFSVLVSTSLGNWQLLPLNQTDLWCQQLTSQLLPGRAAAASTLEGTNLSPHPHPTPSLGTLVLSCSPNLSVPYQAAKAKPLPQAGQSSYANELRVIGTVATSP